MSNLVAVFWLVTVPLMSNMLLVFSSVAVPLLLVTLPSIVKPPSPAFSIVSFVPLFVTSPVAVTLSPPSSFNKLASPLLLRTSPSIVNPPAPSLCIVRLVPSF